MDNLGAQLLAYIMYIDFQCDLQRTPYHIQPAQYLNVNLVEIGRISERERDND